MRNRVVKAMTSEFIPFNLQFFAEGDGDGAGDKGGTGDGAGDGAGDGNGEGDGAGDQNKPVGFDDFLKSGGNQAEFDRRVQQAITTAVSNAQKKWEVLADDKATEAEKLAKMTKDEKAQYLQQKKEKEITDREAAVTRKELMAEAKNTLAEKKLPVSLAEVLNYSDADTCNKSIEAVEKAFQEAVESAVEEKLKGGKPLKSAPGAVSFTKEQVAAMSADEINKNWEAVQESMKHF